MVTKIARRLALGVGTAMMLATAGMPTAGHAADEIGEQIKQMSLEEKVGQLMWTHVYGSSADDTSMAAKNEDVFGPGVQTPADAISQFHLGGVLYFNWSGNISQPTDLRQTTRLSNGLQAAAKADTKIALAITVDQEGGRVARIAGTSTDLPGNMALGATRDATLARKQGEILGSELRAIGINVDFAPDVDVNTNPANPVIGVRSIGSDPALVANLGAAQIRGIQAAGIAATAKHFPGHGDTAVDSHSGLPVVKYDRATLNKHLEPFRAAIAADVDMIMTAHVIVEAIDPEMPGTLSPKILTGLLREDLKFDGVITTDALDMEGAQLAVMSPEQVTEYKKVKESGDAAALKAFLRPIRADLAVRTILAGSDILLNTYDAVAMRDGVIAAVRDGRLSEQRIDQSVRRILEWKAKRKLTTDPVSLDGISATVRTLANRTVAKQIADRSITVLRNEVVSNQRRTLPVVGADRVLVTGSSKSSAELFAESMKKAHTNTQFTALPEKLGEADIARAVTAAKGTDRVVVVVSSAVTEDQQALVRALVATKTPTIVVGAGLPYVLNKYPDAALVAAYGNKTVNFDAAARVLVGQCPVGKLPVDIPADGANPAFAFGTGLTWCQKPTPQPTSEPTPRQPILPPKTGH